MKCKLTTKDLQMLSELLGGEELSYKKNCNYASLATDPELKAKFNNLATNSRKRYDTLLAFLNQQ